MDIGKILKPTESLIGQLLRYAIVGGLAFVVDFGALWGLTEFAGVHYLASAALAFLLGLVTNYLLSIRWVFNTRGIENRTLEFALFAIIGILGLLANEIIMWAATEKAGVPYLFSKVLSTGFVFVWNFGVRKLLLFDGGDSAARLLEEVVHPSKRTLDYLTAMVLGVITVRLGLCVLSDAGMNWDFVNFYNAAQRTFTGQLSELYATGRPGQEQPELQYVGFPVTAYVFAPLGAFSQRTALLIFKLICATCMASGLWLLFRRCVAPLSDPRKRSLVAFLFTAGVLLAEPYWFTFTIGGQATAIGFLLLVAFTHLFAADRLWLAAAALVTAVAIKPFLVLMVPILFMGGQWRLLLRCAAFGLPLMALSVAVLGVDAHLEWFAILQQESSTRWSARWWNNIAPIGIVANFWNYLVFDHPHFGIDAPPAVFSTVKAIYQPLLLVTCAWLAYATARASTDEPFKRNQLVLLSLVFAVSFSVVVWPHYQQFLFVPLAPLLVKSFRMTHKVRWGLAAILLLSMHLELAVQFVAGVPWTPPHSALNVAFTSVLGGGAIVLLFVMLIAHRRELLLTAPEELNDAAPLPMAEPGAMVLAQSER